MVLPVLDDIVKSLGKKKKSTPKSAKTPLQTTKKPTSKPGRKREAPE